MRKLGAFFSIPPHSLLVFILVFVLHGAYALGAGLINSPDSGTYSRWANKLIEVRFDYAQYVKNVSFVIPPIFYAGWITLVAAIKMACGPYWQQAILVINLLAHCVVGVLVVDITHRITHHATAAWMALFLFCIAFDIFNWTRYVLTECTFLCLSFTLFWLLSRLLLEEQSTGKRSNKSSKTRPTSRPQFLLFLIILCPLVLIWRPTGIILFSLVFAALFLSRGLHHQNTKLAQRRFAGLGLTLLCMALFWIGHAAIVQQPKRWPIRFLSKTIQRNSEDYAQGAVVHGRHNTYHAPPVSLMDYATISADKFKHFFHPIHPAFSRSHKALSLLFFVPVYFFAGVTLAVFFMRKTGLGQREESVVMLLFGSVLVFALFHSVTQLDYDWRYRFPILPHLIVLSSIGFATLCNICNKRTRV